MTLNLVSMVVAVRIIISPLILAIKGDNIEKYANAIGFSRKEDHNRYVNISKLFAMNITDPVERKNKLAEWADQV